MIDDPSVASRDRVRGVANPFEGFVHDVDVTRLDRRAGRVAIPLLALAVAGVAVTAGWSAAGALIAAIVVGLALAITYFERDRWRAQDVMIWFNIGRIRRWVEDTGSMAPVGDPARAEVWLGAHQAGTVPQQYRAMAALQTGDSFRSQREIDAMPDATLGDRALKLWVTERHRWMRSGVAKTGELRAVLDQLPDSDDKAMIQEWFSQVDAADRWVRREPSWLEPLLAEWSRARRYKLGVRGTARLWFGRFFVLPAFVVLALAWSATGLSLGIGRDHVPPEYAQTTLSTRGDVPSTDSADVGLALVKLAKALPTAARSLPNELDRFAIDELLAESLPTVIWETGAIDVAGPGDAPGRRVWSTEVLLGNARFTGTPAIVTFDRADGPSYLYVVDAGVGEALRSALGFPAGQVAGHLAAVQPDRRRATFVPKAADSDLRRG
jgi:hypothetical protein